MLSWPTPDQKSAAGVIEGPSGDLEVAVDLPGRSARGLVLVCHPHPQHGGTKDNKVVFMMARGATEAGLAAVRFNFRGVNRSEGSYDAGIGEVDDAACVRDWALSQSGLALQALAGFSFGSAVALRLADRDPPAKLVTVGLPTSYFEDAVPRPDSDWLAIYGDDDEVIDARTSVTTVRELRPAVDVQIMEGAGHFLHGRLTDLRKRLVAHLEDA